MADGPLQVELVAADRTVWSGQATMVIARTVEGDVGVLKDHAPLLSLLADAVVEIDDRRRDGGGGCRRRLHLGGQQPGLDPVRAALLADEIDVKAAESELEEARASEDDDARRPGPPGRGADPRRREGFLSRARCQDPPPCGRPADRVARPNGGHAGCSGGSGWWTSPASCCCSSSSTASRSSYAAGVLARNGRRSSSATGPAGRLGARVRSLLGGVPRVVPDLLAVRRARRRRWQRDELTYDGRREPLSAEQMSLYPDHLVIRCQTARGVVELAMSAASLTGFQSWLEARPPGHGLEPHLVDGLEYALARSSLARLDQR